MAERFIPKAQEIYRHFKGELYQVIAVAEHTETREQLVIYQAMYGDFKIYARPLEMFVSPVDRTKYPDAAQEFRFQLQGPDAGRQQVQSMTLTEGPMGAVPGEPADPSDPSRQNTQGGEPADPSDSSRQNTQEEEPAGSSVFARQNTQGEEPVDRISPDQSAGAEPESGEPGLDPLVLEFLDARTYEQRLNVLAALHHRITNEMITTMSLCCDIEVEGDDVEQRYEDLKQCLITKERFEIKRLV